MRHIWILTVLITCQGALANDIGEIMDKAKQGSAISQYILATEYQYGLGGLIEDDAEAIKWMRMSALQGTAIAQYNLGLMFANGEGTPKNYAKAMEWLLKSANQGYLEGQTTLGRVYAAGEITPKNYEQAIYWLSKAAKGGSVNAQYHLAQSFQDTGNIIKAYAWWSIFLLTEDAHPIKLLITEMESELDYDQILEAQTLAAKCYESGYRDCD
jgi:TPR repeat protein